MHDKERNGLADPRIGGSAAVRCEMDVMPWDMHIERNPIFDLVGFGLCGVMLQVQVISVQHWQAERDPMHAAMERKESYHHGQKNRPIQYMYPI